MTDINSLDFKDLLANATSHVFDTMLSMHIEAVQEESDMVKDSCQIVGSVGFAGEVAGCMNIHVGGTFARQITAAMLGEDPEDVGEIDVFDVVGELSNMIGGDVKSRLCDAGMPCILSIPTTTSGSDFTIESQGWIRHEFLAFRTNEHIALVEVYVRQNNSM
jgi:chemotaxis protein CheX